MELTPRQLAAWNRPHEYLGKSYKVEIKNGRVCGHFNSRCGQYVTRFDFEYNPVEKTQPDPDTALASYTSYQPLPNQHGWLIIGSGDNFSNIPVPQFAHPDELYQWLREEFGYPRTVIIKSV